MISLLEGALGRKTEKEQFLPMQDGDVPDTYAAISAIQDGLGYKPTTSIDQGIPRFIEWYREFHRV